MAKYFFQTNKNLPLYLSSQKDRRVLAISHFHKAMELIRVVSGRVECAIDTYRFICETGDIIFIPSHAVHSVTSLGEDAEIQGMVFGISSVLLEDKDTVIKKILRKDRVKNFIFKKESNINNALTSLFLEVSEQYALNSVTKELELRALLCKITSLLIKEYYSDNEENIDILEPVIDYITLNYKQNIRISDLSKILNVCDDHLIRIFKKNMNITPTKYINKLRLSNALKLLVSTDMSVTEISYEVGFSSVNYMSKVFFENLNITPLKYRKLAKNQE